MGWAQDATAQDSGSAYPAGLDDPAIGLERLQLRLVPLAAACSDTRRVDLVFGISYGDSIEQAQQVLEHVADSSKSEGPAVVSALTGDDREQPRGSSSYASGDDGAAEPGENGGGRS